MLVQVEVELHEVFDASGRSELFDEMFDQFSIEDFLEEIIERHGPEDLFDAIDAEATKGKSPIFKQSYLKWRNKKC